MLKLVNWQNKIKGSFYTLFFIGLNLIYLVIELSFNARILDVSAAFSPTTDFAQLEIYGRSISASGATLFAWRILVPGWSSASLFNIILKFSVITIITFPLVFIGQKHLVDSLVDQSSSETRRTAEILSLLKYGVANGFVEIKELSVDELILQTAEGKMFITLLGVLAYNSHNIRDVLETELDKIAAYAIATQQSAHSKQLFKSYQYVSRQIISHYQQYQNMVDELEQHKAGAYNEAISLYQSAMNQSLLPWLDYQQAIRNNKMLNTVSSNQVASMQYLLMTAQQRINSCSTEACYSENRQKLQLRLAQQLGFYSTDSQWCQSIKNNLHCLKGRDEIEDRILSLRYLALAIEAGLSKVYDSKLEFLKSNDFRSSVFSKIKQQGFHSDSNWRFDQYLKILQDITQQLNKTYLDEYKTAVFDKFKLNLKPRSELAEFSQIPQMQNYFAQAFGELYISPVELNLSLTEFEDRHIAPIYRVKYNSLLNKLKADEQWYESNAPYEESGKSSLRNLVVPAVAIAFSLIFGLLNFINLILNFLFLMIQEKAWLRWSGFTVLVIFILMMPVRHHYLIYSQPAYLNLLSATQYNYGLWVNALDWVAKTEPVVYPVGNILRYNLLHGFSFD